MSSTSVPAMGAAGVGGVAGVAGGAGVGTYDDCQLSALPPCSFFATKAATAASPVTSRIVFSFPPLFFGGGSPLSWATRAAARSRRRRPSRRRGWPRPRPSRRRAPRRRRGSAPPCRGRRRSPGRLFTGVGQGRSGLVAGVGEQRDGAVLGLLRGVHRGDDGGPDRSLHLGTDGLHVVGRLVDEGLLLAQAHGRDTSFSSCGFHSIMSYRTPASTPVLACMRGSGAHEPDRRNHSRTHFSERQSWLTSRPS